MVFCMGCRDNTDGIVTEGKGSHCSMQQGTDYDEWDTWGTGCHMASTEGVRDMGRQYGKQRRALSKSGCCLCWGCPYRKSDLKPAKKSIKTGVRPDA